MIDLYCTEFGVSTDSQIGRLVLATCVAPFDKIRTENNPNSIGRVDFVIDTEGEIKVIELNYLAIGGMLYNTLLSRNLLSTVLSDVEHNSALPGYVSEIPEDVWILHKENLQQVVDSISKPEPTVLYVTPYFDKQYQDTAVELAALKSCGVKFIWIDHLPQFESSDVKLRYDGQTLLYAGNIIDIVWYASTYVHMEPYKHYGYCLLVKAHERKQVVWYPTPASRVIGSKGLLALLSHKLVQDLIFSDEEKMLLTKHLPATYLLHPAFFSDGNYDAFRRKVLLHKERYVMKRAIGSGGAQVFVGKSIDTEAWYSLLFSQPSQGQYSQAEFIVQELIHVQQWQAILVDSRTTKPFKTHVVPVFGAFALRGQFGGLLCRVSTSSDVVNLANGGYIQPVLEYKQS
eukprot:CAMPEP_0183819700 /NCGR_PEP_ID=MMETSP0803_2-20130417/64272_1 /TAXON_ID=195967 /ORGANISM="Crustomastix stigmata, Strain CCMP3273" /LENGTH=400 /DNA_ID=CAMNT_0026064589 /DNA_START=363 /DNA_END=1565 /DNA_ORIENTATION=-